MLRPRGPQEKPEHFTYLGTFRSIVPLKIEQSGHRYTKSSRIDFHVTFHVRNRTDILGAYPQKKRTPSCTDRRGTLLFYCFQFTASVSDLLYL
jgi:hypothetical protein